MSCPTASTIIATTTSSNQSINVTTTLSINSLGTGWDGYLQLPIYSYVYSGIFAEYLTSVGPVWFFYHFQGLANGVGRLDVYLNTFHYNDTSNSDGYRNSPVQGSQPSFGPYDSQNSINNGPWVSPGSLYGNGDCGPFSVTMQGSLGYSTYTQYPPPNGQIVASENVPLTINFGDIIIPSNPQMNCTPTLASIKQQFGRTDGPPIPVNGSNGPSKTNPLQNN